jgi:hypothetical protein
VHTDWRSYPRASLTEIAREAYRIVNRVAATLTPVVLFDHRTHPPVPVAMVCPLPDGELAPEARPAEVEWVTVAKSDFDNWSLGKIAAETEGGQLVRVVDTHRPERSFTVTCWPPPGFDPVHDDTRQLAAEFAARVRARRWPDKTAARRAGRPATNAEFAAYGRAFETAASQGLGPDQCRSAGLDAVAAARSTGKAAG